jgi:hypothetical protein
VVDLKKFMLIPVLGLTLLLVASACKKKDSQTQPDPPAVATSTSTPTVEIQWERAFYTRSRQTNGTITTNAYIYLRVNQTPDPNVAVTLATNSYSSPLTFVSTTNVSGTDYAHYRAATPVVYVPNESCTLTTSVPHKTVSSVATLPGPITVTTNGSSVTFGILGPNSSVFVSHTSGTVITYSNLSPSSPLVIPAATSYPTPTLTYQVRVVNQTKPTINGVVDPSSFVVRDEIYQNVNR